LQNKEFVKSKINMPNSKIECLQWFGKIELAKLNSGPSRYFFTHFFLRVRRPTLVARLSPATSYAAAHHFHTFGQIALWET
jgi:hypothetical protein